MIVFLNRPWGDDAESGASHGDSRSHVERYIHPAALLMAPILPVEKQSFDWVQGIVILGTVTYTVRWLSLKKTSSRSGVSWNLNQDG